MAWTSRPGCEVRIPSIRGSTARSGPCCRAGSMSWIDEHGHARCHSAGSAVERDRRHLRLRARQWPSALERVAGDRSGATQSARHEFVDARVAPQREVGWFERLNRSLYQEILRAGADARAPNRHESRRSQRYRRNDVASGTQPKRAKTPVGEERLVLRPGAYLDEGFDASSLDMTMPISQSAIPALVHQAQPAQVDYMATLGHLNRAVRD